MVMPDKLVLWEKTGIAMRRTYKETGVFRRFRAKLLCGTSGCWWQDGRRTEGGDFVAAFLDPQVFSVERGLLHVESG